MAYQRISSNDLNHIKTILPEHLIVVADGGDFERYCHDETEDLRFVPDVVVLPETVEQVSDLVKLCHENHIAITPRGAGTGLSGGSLAVHGGLMISMERMNRIIDIDVANLQAHVESGVITEVLRQAAAENGLLYPIDPASKGSCFIGGNIAHGSGGPRVIKYGTIREYILNLQVVLPSGEVMWTGANTLKYASGYNLTQLFIGSEGTLGIVTQAVLKLLPKPKADLLLLASFATNEAACAAVSAIFQAGQAPSALEFMERQALEWVIKYDELRIDLLPGTQAYLLIEVDGNHANQLLTQCEEINTVLEEHGCLDVLLADTPLQKETLWNIRRRIGVSVKSHSVYKEKDTVVPRASLPKLISGIKAIGEVHGFESICYGHAGDGNLHVNILKGNMSDTDWHHKLEAGIREIFELTVSLGGTLSGEHGIGLVQRPYMTIKYPPWQLAIMRNIKRVFDPRGIMNPGKIF